MAVIIVASVRENLVRNKRKLCIILHAPVEIFALIISSTHLKVLEFANHN